MDSVIGSALAGMRAATRHVATSASNIANSQTVGTPGETGDKAAYKALDAFQISGPTGGPEVVVKPKDPATSLSYQPNHSLASDEGYVETPNVDLATNLVKSQIAQRSYEANIASIITWDEIQATLLDIKS
ncbi:flagellar basal body rod protein FlgC [Sneathiella aquimaris]|uniref:flagellar basal body rod protein FlgC n=1 Tax=Sneathiella aquimaris TaxID=2599305 RepID=UPI00146CF28F|nr:flagellar basal body rod C-terminal domain-containing protein [Sneathiella aquimaris]